MTVRERVLASRLIQKIDSQKDYAKQIGLDYTLTTDGAGKTTIVRLEKLRAMIAK